MRALAFLLLFCAGCREPSIALTVDASVAPNSELFVRLFTPNELPTCDDIAFGDISLDSFAAVRLLEAPLADLEDLKLAFGEKALLLVEARAEDGALLAVGCTTATVPSRRDVTMNVVLESVARAITSDPVTLLQTGALTALRISDGSETPLRIEMIRADGAAAAARARVKIFDRAGAEASTTVVSGSVVETLSLPSALTGPFLAEIAPAWSNERLSLDGLVARVAPLSLDASLGMRAASDVALVGERQGHAPTVITVSSRRDAVARQVIGANAITTDMPLNTSAFYVGALEGRFVIFHRRALTAEYHLVDGDLVDLGTVDAQPPIAGLPAVSFEGCRNATKNMLVSHPRTGALGTIFTLTGDTLSASPIDPGDLPFEQLATLVGFGGACVDADDQDIAAAACSVFAGEIALASVSVVGPMSAPVVSLGLDIPGLVATDGTPREAIDGEARVLIHARHNDVVELTSYVLDVDRRLAEFRSLEAVLPVEPTVIRRSAHLFGAAADGLVLGIVADDTARVVVLGPSRERDGALRAIGLVTLPCEGCAETAIANVGCRIREEASCPPTLLLETGDIDDDGASEIVIGAFENGERTVTALDVSSL